MRQALPVDRLRVGLEAWRLQDADVLGITPGVTADVFLVLAKDGGRWVAKFNYDYREYFEVGLHASERVASHVGTEQFRVAVPIRTADGRLTEMVEWPDGIEHPLALLAYVPGDPLTAADPAGPALIGDVCGRVHSALLNAEPGEVGLHVIPDQPEGQYPDRDAGQHGWLHECWRELEQRAWEEREDEGLRQAVSVWDGPDVRRWADGISVLDFGHCGWHSLIHVVANRSLTVDVSGDSGRRSAFLAAVERHLPLTAREHASLPLHRVRNAAIYARWVAMEKVARQDVTFNDAWFNELLAMLRRELPLVGLTAAG